MKGKRRELLEKLRTHFPKMCFNLTHGGKHLCLEVTAPSGVMRKVFMSNSPSDPYAYNNAFRDVKKIVDLIGKPA